jgi:hypothetical protein
MNRIIISAAALAAVLILPGCATTPEERMERAKERAAIRAEKRAARAAILAERVDRTTPEELIKPIPTSPLIYSHMTCAEIAADLTASNAEEARLLVLHNRRAYADTWQSFFLKIGAGDGAETAQIAAIRGKRDAAIAALEQKCALTPESPAVPTAPSSMPEPPAPPPAAQEKAGE